MLRLSKLADYGIIILHCLADELQFLSAKEIARRVHLSLPTVSKILKILSEAGLVVATRGAVGGYRLTKPSTAMSITEVITAIDGQPALTECSEKGDNCAYNSVCSVKHNWQKINQFILDTLSQITLADMGKTLSVLPTILPQRGVKTDG